MFHSLYNLRCVTIKANKRTHDTHHRRQQVRSRYTAVAKHRWIPVEHRTTFKMAVMASEFVHGVTADYIRSAAVVCCHTNRPLRSTMQFWSPVCTSIKDCRRRTDLSQWPRSITHATGSVTSAGSLAIFKKHLKTFLITSAQDSIV